jgi:hypothetical protein
VNFKVHFFPKYTVHKRQQSGCICVIADSTNGYVCGLVPYYVSKTTKHLKNSACHLPSRWFLIWLIFRPWRWRRYVPSKRRLTLNGLHGVLEDSTLHNPAVRTSSYTKSLMHPQLTYTSRIVLELISKVQNVTHIICTQTGLITWT